MRTDAKWDHANWLPIVQLLADSDEEIKAWIQVRWPAVAMRAPRGSRRNIRGSYDLSLSLP